MTEMDSLMPTYDLNWYAVRLIPLKERMAILALIAQGVDVFWPHYVAGVRIGKRRGYSFRSWIPHFAFVSEGSQPINGYRVDKTQNVIGLLKMSGTPMVIPSDLIWDIKSMAEPDGLIPVAGKKFSPPKNMVPIRGENLIECLEQLRSLKRTAWAKGMIAEARNAA